MEDFQLTFNLKQHTPLIHFQHEQVGATLRASELRPKLDKFLIAKKGGWDKVPRNWKIPVSNKDHKPLDYKIKIVGKGDTWSNYVEEPKLDNYGNFRQRWNEKEQKHITQTFPYPLYFGNMGEDYNDTKRIKKFELEKGLTIIKFISFPDGLIDFIAEHFPEFIATHNFGSRQGKGFGSFYLSDINTYPVLENWFDYKTNIRFRLDDRNKEPEKDKFKKLFERVDWFYRSLRSGINRKKPKKLRGNMVKDENGIALYDDVFYFKSLLFLYFKSKKIQWEKKTIKEAFFNNDGKRRDGSYRYYGAETQSKNQPASDLLNYSSSQKNLVKTLLGLSSVESWKSYGATIEKENIRVSDDEKIERYKSPILFKLIELSEGIYSMYIKFNQNEAILGKWFSIKNGNRSTNLQVPTTFDLHDFFAFICDPEKFQIDSHVESRSGFHNQPEFHALKSIFNNLTKIQ